MHLFYFLFPAFLHALNKEQELIEKLLNGYNREIRPIQNASQVITVKFYMTLQQMISVVEKTEEVTTSVYITASWKDYRLQWDPDDYEGLKESRIPSPRIWRPDIVLYNNDDGKYDPTLPTNVVLKNDGDCEWLPPAIYKSDCKIHIDLFPFDWQNCTMVFRSYTYDRTEIKFHAEYKKTVIDSEAYTRSGEWQLVHCPVMVNHRADDPNYEDITFYFIIRRKPLFYVINILIPCVLISSLSIFTFLLPSASNQKIQMSISVLLGLTVYLFLLAKRTPETSLAIPLISRKSSAFKLFFAINLGLFFKLKCRFLMFAMVAVTCSIVCSVIVLNIYHKKDVSTNFPKWLNVILFDFLPRYTLIYSRNIF
jgi:cation transporter family protein